LKKAARPVGSVCKIAVIASRNAEHPDYIQSETQHNGFPGRSSKEYSQASHVNSNEWQTSEPLDPTRISEGLRLVRDRDSAHEAPQVNLVIEMAKMITKTPKVDCNITVTKDFRPARHGDPVARQVHPRNISAFDGYSDAQFTPQNPTEGAKPPLRVKVLELTMALPSTQRPAMALT
jgi:hypothetical protein